MNNLLNLWFENMNKNYAIFVLCFCLIFQMYGIIKVEYNLTTPYFETLKSIRPQLRRLGIVTGRDSDVILTNRISKKHLEKGKPIIVMEDFDYATVSLRNGEYLGHHSVKALFQTYSLNPLSLNNEERFVDCYHYGLVNKVAQLGKNSMPIVGQKFIDSNLLNKVKTVVCTTKHPLNKKFNYIKRKNVNFQKSRPIDVFFAGSLTYANFKSSLKEVYKWHRVSAIEAIHKIKGIRSFVQSGRSIPYKKYISMMQQSKIVVSPWGWGEFCYRDFEAMLTGAVLIKPDTGFVKMKPNVYQNNITYVPCKVDFSDLEEKVHMVLSNYQKFTPMRYKARQMLVQYTKSQFAYDFAQAIKEVLSKHEN